MPSSLCLPLLLLLGAALTPQLHALDPFATDDVTRLTGSTIKEALSDGRVHLVKFYLPHQGDSQRAAPLWKDLAAHHHIAGDERLSVSVVDCSNEENVDLCSNMPSFPLFKVFYKGYDAGTYKGPLDLDTMREYALGAAHYFQPKKGHWLMEWIKAYFKFVREAYTHRPHAQRRAERLARDEF